MRNEGGGIFIGPDDGKALMIPVGGGMVVKVRAEDTGGAYSVHNNTIPPGSPGPRSHLHRGHEEAFYVLERLGAFTERYGATSSRSCRRSKPRPELRGAAG